MNETLPRTAGAAAAAITGALPHVPERFGELPAPRPTSSPTINLGPLYAALAKAQAAMEHAAKSSQNPHFKSRYADLAEVVDACRDALTSNGLCVIQMPTFDDGKVGITTVIGHEAGASIESTLWLRPTKDDPQGVGSAITYGRRYALAAMVGVAPDDDDGNAASGRPTAPPQPVRPNPAYDAKRIELIAGMLRCETIDDLDGYMERNKEATDGVKENDPQGFKLLVHEYRKRKAAIVQHKRDNADFDEARNPNA